MNRLLLFNPENDIALGFGRRGFTPPRQAALLHRAGASLPFWIGDSDDFVLVHPDDLEAVGRWTEQMKDFGISGPSPVAAAPRAMHLSPTPWGWSVDAAEQFRRVGVDETNISECFPDADKHRQLSHRRTALAVLQSLVAQDVKLKFPLPIEADTTDAVEAAVGAWGVAMIKSPWSSSGRGVFPVDADSFGRQRHRVAGLVRAQGSVMVEKRLQCVADFAMLFNYGAEGAMFAGMSHFVNDTAAATKYAGNYVASDEMIMAKLSRFVPAEVILEIQKALPAALMDVLGNCYRGPLGVDMMICRDTKGGCFIDPCVEVNLRYTMGFVAKGIWQRTGREGWMRLSPAGRVNAFDGLPLIPRNQWFEARLEAPV